MTTKRIEAGMMNKCQYDKFIAELNVILGILDKKNICTHRYLHIDNN